MKTFGKKAQLLGKNGANVFSDIYRNKKVFVTGHTGFKGSWLSVWLQKMGAEVYGYSLPPENSPNHWDLLKLSVNSEYSDIRDFEKLLASLQTVQPEIVFHMAAQPLVRASYNNPLETWQTNVIGTANLLDACRNIPSVRAIVIVTTDKCYENLEIEHCYVESDRLGGHDPYSASKAATELVTLSFRKSFYNTQKSPLVASVRAGNVIGGGDWSTDRLIPDIIRAFSAQTPLVIRNPKATRPWQHVLDALYGYLKVGQSLLEGNQESGSAWNFGPDQDGSKSVEDIITILQSCGIGVVVQKEECPQPHEAILLQLDSNKAKLMLNWRPMLTLSQSLEMTADWYRAYIDGHQIITKNQLDAYVDSIEKV